MRLGIGSYTYPFAVSCGSLTAFDLLAKAVLLKAEVVQFCENLSLLSLSNCELDDLVDRASNAGIGLELGTRGLEPSNIARHAELATRLGAGFIRVVADDGTLEQSLADVERKLKACFAACKGVVIAIENHDRLPVADLRRLVETFGPDRLGITLDTANSLGCLEGTNEVAEKLARYTRCLHVKDVAATRFPSNLGFTIVGTVAGKGDVDIPRVLGQMTPLCQSAILEQWPPQAAGAPAPIDLENRWASEGFAYMGGLVRARSERASHPILK